MAFFSLQLALSKKKSIDKELNPVLDRLMSTQPDFTNYQDVEYLCKWLTQPTRRVEEFRYVLRDMFADFKMEYGCDSSTIYTAKTITEALAIRCPILEGSWAMVVWHLINEFEKHRQVNLAIYGSSSSILSTWIIQVVGETDLCPDPELRLNMLLLFRTFVKIDHTNYKQALKSLLSLCPLLDQQGDTNNEPLTADIIDCLKLFMEGKYLQHFSLDLAQKLRQYRNMRKAILHHDFTQDYSIGLKTISQPRDPLSIIALLRWASGKTLREYNAFQNDPNYEVNLSNILSPYRLSFLLKSFRPVLQEPELINITSDVVMDVIEAMVMVIWSMDGSSIFIKADCLFNINKLISALYLDGVHKYTYLDVEMDHKDWIRKLRSTLTLRTKQVLDKAFKRFI